MGAIISADQSADGMAGLQQFSNDDGARFPGRAGHHDPWLDHDRLLLRLVVEYAW